MAVHVLIWGTPFSETWYHGNFDASPAASRVVSLFFLFGFSTDPPQMINFSQGKPPGLKSNHPPKIHSVRQSMLEETLVEVPPNT